MPSVVIRPALVGKFATVLEDVAAAQDASAAAIVRQLMTDAWGPNLENAPVGQPGKDNPTNPVDIPDKPTGPTDYPAHPDRATRQPR